MTSSTRQLAAITFIDIVGYSTLMNKDEDKAIHLLSLQKDVVFPIISKYNGKIIKEMGDGLLITFTSAIEAVRCSLEIQSKIENIKNLNYRIGIHLGDVMISNNDTFGDGVNIASRIQNIAKSGQVCISKAVYDAIQNHLSFQSKYLGKTKLKGIKEDTELFIVSDSKEQLSKYLEEKAESLSLPDRPNYKTLLIGFVFSIIVAVSFISFFKSYSSSSDDVTIAILPFSNTKKDKEFDFLKEQFPIDLIERLSQIDSLSIKDYSIVKKMIESEKVEESNIFGLPSAKIIGKKMNSQYVIYGTYLILQQQIRIQCFIYKVENGIIFKTWSRNYGISEIILILDDFPNAIQKLVKNSILNKKADNHEK